MKSSIMKPLSVLCWLAAFCTAAIAAEGDAAPEDVNEPRVRVVSVSGIAKKTQLNDENPEWTPLKADETLGPLTIVRTGLNSRVVLDFADRGQVVIDSGTKIGISQLTAIRGQGQDGAIRARLGLKYGSMRLKVDRTRGANDFSVSTAVATLSVRGTEGKIAFSGDKGLALFGDEGTFAVEKGARDRQVQGDQRTDGDLTRSGELKTMARDNQMGDAGSGLTPEEKKNLARYGSGRGIFGFVGNPSTDPLTLTSLSHEESHNHEEPREPGGTSEIPSGTDF